MATESFQRLAIHEASHALIGILQGFRIYGVMIDGPDDQAGRTWHAFPPERTPATERLWAKKELAVFAAGYLGEREFFGRRRKNRSHDADRAIVESLAFLAIHSQDEVHLLQMAALGGQNRNDLRRRVPRSRWDDYLHLIEDIERNVAESIHANRSRLQSIASQLLRDGYVRGSDLYSIAGVPWCGRSRTATWSDLRRDH